MKPDPGSFRDPSNRVLIDGDRVLRGLDLTAYEDYEALRSSRFFERGIERGQLVPTRLLDPAPAHLGADGWAAVLEHDRIPVISYPYEWPFAMLREAALLQLDLALGAIDEQLITKDATPYNVQFVGSRPVHIDIGSFERLSDGEPWFGYRQFCEQFLFPLVLTARRGLTHQARLRGSVRGISPRECVACLRWHDIVRPSLFIHVGLQGYADRRRSGEHRDVRAELTSAGFGPAVITGQLRRLRRLVEGLSWGSTTSTWSGYSDRSHYTDADLRAKEELVREVVNERRRHQVLDLGANDGHFSQLVLPSADYVVAVDHDPLVVDRLFRRLADQGEERVLPLVLDLRDPSGGLGWRSRERAAFADRVSPDVVLCLALIAPPRHLGEHPARRDHRVPRGSSDEVVLEFPTPADPMVQLLVGQKKERSLAADRYSVAALERSLATRFDTRRRVEAGTRVLYHLVARGGGAPIEVTVDSVGERVTATAGEGSTGA